MKMSEAKKGREVVFKPFKSNPCIYDIGIITSTNDKFVFVRYGNDYHSKATRPEDIEYTNKCRECGAFCFEGDLCQSCRTEIELHEIERDLGLFQADRGERDN